MGICHNKQYEREFVNKMNAEGHFCMRIAGSGSGPEAVCDCILFKEGKTYLVEVKATKEKKYCTRSDIKKQLIRMNIVANKLKIETILAIKHKYGEWEILGFKDGNMLHDKEDSIAL